MSTDNLSLSLCLFCSWKLFCFASVSEFMWGRRVWWVKKVDIGCGFQVGLLWNSVFVGDWRSEMERDFLGLGSKEPLAVVKEEVNNDGCTDPGLFLSYSYYFWASSTFRYLFICSLLQILTYFSFKSFNFFLSWTMGVYLISF